jgi:hypothetical protein
MRVTVVVPTNRPDRLAEFGRVWGEGPWDDAIVVFDGPRSECSLEWPNATIYCWDDYEALCGSDSWIFSRRDSACRSFGFLQAVRRGADCVITLDDDCHPMASSEVPQFLETHLHNLRRPPPWVSTVPGLRVRGVPYDEPDMDWDGPPVLVSMGLWCDVPDLGAVEALALRSALSGEHRSMLTRFRPAGGTRVASPHQFFPFCGMNFAFRRAALPALYFPRMGEGSCFARFDDIWCGLLLQRIFAQTGDLITIGEPWVRHTQASDAMENLVKEAPGIAAHEQYWRILAALPIEGDTLPACARSAAENLELQKDIFLAEWGRALRAWLSLCEKVMADTDPGSGSH